MVSHEELDTFFLGFPGVWLDYPFGKEYAVYKFGTKPDGKITAIIEEKSAPLRVSLKCDPQLAEVLREKYETVLPGYHLNKKHWNTIICSGQLSKEEIQDLFRLSYQLVGGVI